MIKKIVWKLMAYGAPKRPAEIDADRFDDTEPQSQTANHRFGLLSNKNVLITGGGRNIGRAIALEMAGQGANIYFTDIVGERLTKVEEEVGRFAVKTKGFLSDVSDEGQCNALVGRLAECRISIDVLVNNVGIKYMNERFIGSKMSDWTRTYETNLFGPIYLTNLMTQAMVRDNLAGSIIFITSIHEKTIVRWPSYSSSKAALGMVIKELAVELAQYGIRVNGIAPGAVEDESEKHRWPHVYTPLRQKPVDARYIGRAVVYLSSDYFSKQTTGTVITVDSGLSLYNYRVAQVPPEGNPIN
jgi:NAD(P)-dependent dehydrogenase (short-subunit alcohol dehydrogenase family)